MPSGYWEDAFDDADIDDYGDIDAFHVVRGDDGWTIYADVDGDWTPVGDTLDDDSMEQYFWDDLYDWAMDNDVDVDRTMDYAAD